MKHDHSHDPNRFAVLPTPARLDAVTEYTGRGVTIAFLDSGFSLHDDLIEPINRLAAYHDVTNADSVLAAHSVARSWDWHGTQTSVVAAGNGRLSGGFYRGLASDSRVVLVKVGEEGRITEPNIECGLRWVIENKDRYDIRVVSISLGGDEDVSYRQNAVDRAAEDAVAAGLVVVVAAGNSGCTDHRNTVPPANAPSVITVGGYNDNNQLARNLDLYCSSYGVTADGIVKPEIIAPAMWVAAPILPGTDSYARAEALSRMASSPDYVLRELSRVGSGPSPNGLWEAAGLPDSLRLADMETIRRELNRLVEDGKIVAAHYQHVDGTSFAAPIVASLVAQMLEANPALTPAAVKQLLISTAVRIAGAPAIRQGYGVVNARRAVEAARREQHRAENHFFCAPRVVDGYVKFTHHDDSASTVSLASSFHDWDPSRDALARDESGLWHCRIPTPGPGLFFYKLVIDGARWIEDPANLAKEPDGYGGFNSVLQIGEGK